jgi:hypothetical protein
MIIEMLLNDNIKKNIDQTILHFQKKKKLIMYIIEFFKKYFI